MVFILYGFAKLNDAQFTVLDSELARPMGEVSGFWLTWYYFGYSSVYGGMIAAVQIVGGVLLMWPRSSLVGALLLLPVVTNIILTDVFFGIGVVGVSTLLLACLVLVIAPDVHELARVLTGPPHAGSRRATLVRASAMVIVLAAAWSATYWVANYNNRRPTPIDGTWESTDARVQQVFFERNRAYMAVFRGEGRADRVRHFELDSAGRLEVWEQWLRKGQLVYEGHWGGSDRILLWSEGRADTLVLIRSRGPS